MPISEQFTDAEIAKNIEVGSVGKPDRGLKFDDGKAPVWRGFIKYFPRAIKAVAEISGYGYGKYKSWGGWADVPDCRERYSDALGRHLCDEAIRGNLDPESSLADDAHAAWNAMARLERRLRDEEHRGKPN